MASSLIVDGDFSHLKFIPSLHEGGKYRVRYGASQVLEKTKVRSHREFSGDRIFRGQTPEFSPGTSSSGAACHGLRTFASALNLLEMWVIERFAGRLRINEARSRS